MPVWGGESKGKWLDACSRRVNTILGKAADAKGYILTQSDITPEDPAIRELDLREMDNGLGQFDIVTCSDTLEHIDNYKAALKALRGYTRGRCYLGVPIQRPTTENLARWWREPHHKIDPSKNKHMHEWDYSPAALIADVQAAGFEVIGCYFNAGDPVQHGGMLLIMR